MKTCERCGKELQCEMSPETSIREKPATCWCKSMPALKSLPPQYKDCLCPECLAVFTKSNQEPTTPSSDLVEGVDFYLEHGLYVFTAEYHRKRGACCHSDCRHCPY